MTGNFDMLPSDKRRLLERTVEALRGIPGVAAVVLGGSYARGTQHAGSDLDAGLYYRGAASFSIAEIRRLAGGCMSVWGQVSLRAFG